MTSRSKDIIFLLGAGASAEAGIPVSSQMIQSVEEHLRSRDDWRGFRQLYNHVKSAIHFSAGLKGHFGDGVPFNIEILVNTLYELERNEEHPLYPFIAAWNSRFVGLAGTNFQAVRDFRKLILGALKKWMCVENAARSNYYKGLSTVQQDLTYPLHVFSLNYDLCVERLNLSQPTFRVETGFADYGRDNPWDFERFADLESTNNPPPQVLLYKLHGSVNWKRDPDTKNLFAVEQIESVDEEQMEVIFGRDFKLEAADPYLFFAYEFRRFTLLTHLIVTIGYGYGDLHINKMLTQSLRSDPERRLLVVQNYKKEDVAERREQVAKQLELNRDQAGQVIIDPRSAKEFLEAPDLAKSLIARIPAMKDAGF
jgi:hypothetical protein